MGLCKSVPSPDDTELHYKQIEQQRMRLNYPTNCRNLVHIETPSGKSIREVYTGVDDGEALGIGITGKVRKIKHKKTGMEYAVKRLKLNQLKNETTPHYEMRLQQLRDEVSIMFELDHPNIVPLKEVYESREEIFLVQELCTGGDLFDKLEKQPNEQYTEQQCATLVKQMLCSVQYIHSKGIIHRDLKLENFLFSSNEDNSELKMIDFGFSKHFEAGDVQHDVVGTLYTIAPEVFLRQYDERCDLWSIGVITYLLLSGIAPFGGCTKSHYGEQSTMEVRDKLVNGCYDFEDEIWDNISEEAKDFIRSLLVTDPRRRLTAREAKQSPWLRQWAMDDNSEHSTVIQAAENDNILSPDIINALISFKESSELRRLLCEVLSFTLLPKQFEGLRNEFEKLDTDGSGEISLANFKTILIQHACGAKHFGSVSEVTERDIEDIFDAVHICDTGTRKIHWHEFIAAGLSQCQFDDRNLKMAFEMIDKSSSGSITFGNVMELLISCGFLSVHSMKRRFGDILSDSKSLNKKVSYDEFRLLMRSQRRVHSVH